MVTARDSKPDLLYLSPVVPSLTGNGLAMRAGAVLEGLAECYSVSLLVVTLYPPFVPCVPEVFETLCRRTAVVARPRQSWLSFLAPSRWMGPLAAWRRLPVDVIHVFRLAMAPYARPFRERHSGVLSHLDLDDIESTTHRRISSLCEANRDHILARFEEAQAKANQEAEREAFAGFGRIYVCSEADRAELQANTRAELCVLPNAVRIPAAAPGAGSGSGSRLLFVGTLGYYPNDDGARYLCDEIVPRVRTQWPGDFQVEIAGPGASSRLLDAADRAGVHVAGWVPDLEPCYRAADVVVVPVRAGGGTRIKVLEAFSYRRPVVTTAAGIEGIDARHEEHVLIAGGPEEFAGHCVRLMGDRALRERLARNAWDLLARRYSIEVLKRTIASSLPPALRRESRSGARPPFAR